MQLFQGLLSWTRSDNPICIDKICNSLTLYDLNLGYRGIWKKHKFEKVDLQSQFNSAQLTTAQVAAVVAPTTFSSRKRVTFITLPFAYLSWILDQVRPFWSWSLPEGASSSFPWDQEAFQRNWTRKKGRKRDILMMMTVVIMFIENLPSNGRGNNSKQLAYCQSFPWNREAL